MRATPGLVLDQLEAYCLCAVAAYDAGYTDALMFADVAQRWSRDGILQLGAQEREALTYHRPGRLEWTELVIPQLVGLLVDVAGDEWVMEALSRAARLVAVSSTRLEDIAGAAAATGSVVVDSTTPLVTRLFSAFPSVDDRLPAGGVPHERW